jgi:hypothetical protein
MIDKRASLSQCAACAVAIMGGDDLKGHGKTLPFRLVKITLEFPTQRVLHSSVDDSGNHISLNALI